MILHRPDDVSVGDMLILVIGTDNDEQIDLGGWLFHSRKTVEDGDPADGICKFTDLYYRLVEPMTREPNTWIIPAKYGMILQQKCIVEPPLKAMLN